MSRKMLIGCVTLIGVSFAGGLVYVGLIEAERLNRQRRETLKMVRQAVREELDRTYVDIPETGNRIYLESGGGSRRTQTSSTDVRKASSSP